MTAAATVHMGVESRFELHRVELTAFCRRMLGPGEAEDAVQETFLRAWRGFERFEGRSSLRTWLRRIATNVCVDMLVERRRRPRPVDFQFGAEPIADELRIAVTTAEGRAAGDSAEAVIARDDVSRAFVATVQLLPPRQRAVLILRDVLRWRAREVAELLETSVVAVNSALERARATLRASDPDETATPLDPAAAYLVTRFVDAFQRYDIETVTSLLHGDANNLR